MKKLASAKMVRLKEILGNLKRLKITDAWSTKEKSDISAWSMNLSSTALIST